MRSAALGRRWATTAAAVAAGLTALATLTSGACAPRPAATTGASPAPLLDVVLLFEEHRIDDAVDTLVTWIAPGRVRVSHRGGDAILDAEHDRFILLDPVRRSARESSLSVWEGRIREATLAARAAADSVAGVPGATPALTTLRFDAAGDGGTIAGHACQRHHLFAERPLFPGEWEEIEQEIWVTSELEVPAAAMSTYRRVFESLDWIDFDARVERPPGVRMRLVQRRRPRGGGATTLEVETTEVVRVERRRVAAEVFAIPDGWARSQPNE